MARFASPWSHGLFMAVIWSMLAALLAACSYRSWRAGVLIGLVVFSHWLLDFIAWDNLPLFLAGSPQVGFGLFKAIGSATLIVELALFAAGLVLFLITSKRKIVQARA